MSWLSGWSKRVKFTIDHDDIDSALSWFPVRLRLSADWVSPAATEDPDTKWGDDAKAIDGDTGTYAFALSANYNHYLNFTLDTASDTDRVRTYMAAFKSPDWQDPVIDLDLYYDGDWHNIFSGTISRHTWVEKVNPAGIKSVTKARIRGTESTYVTHICEFEFMDASRDNSCVFDEVGANSKKIAITKDDGTTELYGEIEKWDNTNELADIWVSRDGWATSDTADTDGYIYYDNTHADNDTYIGIKNSTPAQSVWDGNFTGSYRMADGVDNEHIYDSTSNNHDGTKKAANQPLEADAKIGKGQDFSGGAYYISLPTSLNVRNDHDFTISCWLNKTDPGDVDEYIVLFTEHGYARFYAENADDKLHWGMYDGVSVKEVIEGTASAVGWHKMSMTYDMSEKKFKAYLDGTYLGQSAALANTTYQYGTVHNYLGLHVDGSSAPWQDKLDEVKASDSIRTDAWIKAEYESERDDLITWGSEEDRKGAAMHHYKMLKE